MSEKYFFRTIGPSWDKMCTEKCLLTGHGIGSINCQECKNCTDHNGSENERFFEGPDWIICSEIEKATGK